MSDFASHIIPTLDSLGVWAYWIVGLAAFLESWWVTGVVVPGTLIVDAGGALVSVGHLNFFDLVWFVAIGAILGGEASWHTGRWLGGRFRMPQNKAFSKAQDLVKKNGPLALVIGRFLGPVASLAGLAAALADMDRRQFIIWNIVSGFVYAISHVALGYVAGDLLSRISPYLPRLVMPLLLVGVLVLVTWLVTSQARRGAPAMHEGLMAIRNHVAGWTTAQRFSKRFPHTASFISHRFDPRPGGGLLTTAIMVLLIYLIALFIDGALDLVLVPDTEDLDQRVANLAHAYWSPVGLTLASWLTEAGRVPVATLVALGSIIGFLGFGYRAAAAGMAVAVVGNAVTVTALKLMIGRARPELSYFLESSNSFPSGHAAISVALYGTLALMLWREKIIGPTMALVAGVGIAVGLGLTRVYLVVHFLSDVLNGWVVGAIWMLIGFAFSATLRRGRVAVPEWHKYLGTTLMLACFAAAGWSAYGHRWVPAANLVLDPPVVEDLPHALAVHEIPMRVVSLSGNELLPLSIVTVGLSLSELETRLADGSWATVPRPGSQSIVKALKADILHRTDNGATAPLAFRAAEPAIVTLRSPDAETLLRIWDLGVDSTGHGIFGLAFAPWRRNLENWQEIPQIQSVVSLLGGEPIVIQVPAKADFGEMPDGTSPVTVLSFGT